VSTPANSTSQAEAPQRHEIVADKWVEIYKEICANIRTTDEISFKLLLNRPAHEGLVRDFLAGDPRQTSA
jgi:hypothetical protein